MRGKYQSIKNNLSMCHFVQHIYHTDYPEIEPVPSRSEVGD